MTRSVTTPAAAAAAEVASAAVGGVGGAVGRHTRRNGVARVRVAVRSSVYLILADLEAKGAILMQEVKIMQKQKKLT